MGISTEPQLHVDEVISNFVIEKPLHLIISYLFVWIISMGFMALNKVLMLHIILKNNYRN